jgi:hypothetical protein
MDAGTKMFSPWVGSQFSYDTPPTLQSHVITGVVTGIEQDGKAVLRVGSGLSIDNGEWFASEDEARRRLVVMLCDKWEALRTQIDKATASLRSNSEVRA